MGAQHPQGLMLFPGWLQASRSIAAPSRSGELSPAGELVPAFILLVELPLSAGVGAGDPDPSAAGPEGHSTPRPLCTAAVHTSILGESGSQLS